MRRKKVFVPLEDDALISLDRLWEQMYESQRCEAIRQALSCLAEEDREIFYRFYDLSQTTGQIAEQLHLNARNRPFAPDARTADTAKAAQKGRYDL